MPKLIKLYITQSLIGLGIATCFVVLLLAFNVGNLWYLVTHTDVGPFAAFLLWAHFAVLCGGVQFAIRVMRLGHEDDQDTGPRGGTPVARPVRVEATTRVPKVGRKLH